MDKHSRDTVKRGQESPATKSPFMHEFPLLLFITAIFFLNFLSRTIPAPLMPDIENDLGLAHAQAGGLFFFISMGYFPALVCSGFVSSAISHKRTLAVSATALGAAVLFISCAQGLLVLRTGLLLLGIAAGLYLPSGIATLTDLVDAKNWGKAIAIHELAPNVSFIAGPLITEALMPSITWRGVLVLLGSASITAGILFAFFGRGGNFPGSPPGFKALGDLFKEPPFWIMMALFSLGISGTLGIYSMLPLYLVAGHGLSRAGANTLIACSRLSGLVMSFVAGWLSDRIGPEKTMGSILLCTGLATILLGSTRGTLLIWLVFLQPMFAACFFPPAFASLSSIGTPKTRNVAVSLTVPVGFVLGAGAVPSFIGYMGDMGSFGLGISLTGVLMAIGSLMAMGMAYIKRRHRAWKP